MTHQNRHEPPEKYRMKETGKIRLMLFRWAGRWGPFRIRIQCGECSLTRDVIVDVLENELAGIPVLFECRDWLSEWWRPLLKGGWHAPVVMVDGRVISQGGALNRGVLTEAVIKAFAGQSPLRGNIVFGKASCPHCKRAGGYLREAGIHCVYRDVVREPAALYEMLVRVKPFVGTRIPITVPQIWLDGTYIGGAEALGSILRHPVEANPDRGQCSLSPAGHES